MHWLRIGPGALGGGHMHSPAAFITIGFTQTCGCSQIRTFSTSTDAVGGTVTVLDGEYVVVQCGARPGGQTPAVGGVSETVQLVPGVILVTV